MYHNFGLRDAFEQSAFGLRFVFARAAGKRGKTTTGIIQGHRFGILAHYKSAEVLIIPNFLLPVSLYLTS